MLNRRLVYWPEPARRTCKKCTMKENPKDRIEALVDALLESDQMESAVRYVRSGRRFASLETEEIKKRWTQATRTFLMSCGGVNPGEMDDLGSELRLRKVALLCENVSAKTAAAARLTGREDDPEGQARILERIRRFRDDLEGPRN
jgi:hypothetical protein